MKNKNRYNKKQSTLLTHQLKTAAKELRNHPNITIKKADKTNIFVVLNKTDYHWAESYIYIYIYKFKCPLGDCISDNNNIYVGFLQHPNRVTSLL